MFGAFWLETWRWRQTPSKVEGGIDAPNKNQLVFFFYL